MAIDPNIALGIKTLELPNPLTQYGQIAAIQNAQNQNALAQYQIESAKRTDAAQNALGAAYKQSFDPTTGEVDRNLLFKNLSQGGAAHMIPDVQAKLLESQVKKATLGKTQAETEEKTYKLQKEKLEDGWKSMFEAPTRESAIKKLQDGVSKGLFTMADASQGISELQEMQTPEQYQDWRIKKITSLVSAKDQLELSKQTVKDTDRGGYIERQVYDWQGKPVGVPIKLEKTETFSDKTAKRQADIAAGRLGVEQKRLAQDLQSVVYQPDPNTGNIVALPARLAPGQVPVARTAVAPGAGFQPLQAKPSEAESKENISINQQKAIVNSAIKYLDKTPSAFGLKRGMQGELIGTSMDTPKEIEARAYVYNVVSGVIKERAGTAQSAGEKETLNRFLPSEYDNAAEITAKFNAFNQYLDDKQSGTTKKPGGTSPKLPANPAANPYGSMSNDELLKALGGK